jgi:hypothetical protein
MWRWFYNNGIAIKNDESLILRQIHLSYRSDALYVLIWEKGDHDSNVLKIGSRYGNACKAKESQSWMTQKLIKEEYDTAVEVQIRTPQNFPAFLNDLAKLEITLGGFTDWIIELAQREQSSPTTKRLSFKPVYLTSKYKVNLIDFEQPSDDKKSYVI